MQERVSQDQALPDSRQSEVDHETVAPCCPVCSGTGVIVDADNVTKNYEPTMGCPGPCEGTGRVGA